MKSNYVPPSVNSLLFEHYSEFFIYSFDVSKDGRYAIIALSLEDPDFPELWIYDDTTNTIQKIDDKSVLIDDPMGKAFWAENQHDVVIVSHDEQPFYALMTLMPDTFEFIEMREVEEPTQYMKDKNEQVISFLTQSVPRQDDNEPSGPVYETDNPYEKCLKLFLDDFRTTIKEEQIMCKLSGEAGIKTWDIYRYLFGTLLDPLNQRIEECGLAHDVELIDANIPTLILDQFKPQVGKCYEINWGEIDHNGQKGIWSARIRVDDLAPEKWIDLDSELPLDKYLASLEVKWFREIHC